ncbi:OLC1v1032711C7 [Oldenlandia corymbosa var. corymbosa]|uniref:OLC1v1032711C7 n=1 Tax=Oldenlandia corymbosa var. corymbosa TaxID=529605 RepID=A0AAV1CPC0_OLDCO|nr:OLC1v1032711C7 [Oldenlandia corymbosa var. corymbosa]
MLVSALLTSVLINSGLCVLLWALYSSLRKRPDNYRVYAPRLLAECNSRAIDTFRLERLLSTPSWVARAWQTSEEELLSSAGLDAVVFRRLITFSLRVITVAGVIGVFILLPVNFSGDQLHDVDFANLTSNSLDIFTISNVKDGSNRLWVHFGAVYVVTIFTCFLLYNEFKYVSSKRISYFLTSKPQPGQFTILVRSVPVSRCGSVSDSVERFFREYHPNTYLSHVVIRRTSKVRHLVNDGKRMYRRLIDLRKERCAVKSQHGGLCGLFRRQSDIVNDYERKLEELEENVRLGQSEASLAGEEVRAAFVSFKTRYGATIAIRMQQVDDPTHWVTEAAPEPHDVYWPFFSESFIRRWVSQLVVLVAYISITLLFLIPVVIVQGLTNLSQLQAWLPPLKDFLKEPFVHQVITGYLPSLILLFFLWLIPHIMKFLSSAQGYISHSEIIRSACNKFLWFTIWNVYFGNVLSGSVFNQIYTFLEPANVPSRLAVAVPAQFINVYSPKYDTAGKFWPIVHNSMIFSLLLMHAIAVGIFTLKKISLASSLLFPLPIVTLIFNSYCRKRFLPNFNAYSAETLIEKDRKDLNNASTAEFFNKLSSAYQDPALLPVRYSAAPDEETAPLLSSTETEGDGIS